MFNHNPKKSVQQIYNLLLDNFQGLKTLRMPWNALVTAHQTTLYKILQMNPILITTTKKYKYQSKNQFKAQSSHGYLT